MNVSIYIIYIYIYIPTCLVCGVFCIYDNDLCTSQGGDRVLLGLRHMCVPNQNLELPLFLRRMHLIKRRCERDLRAVTLALFNIHTRVRAHTHACARANTHTHSVRNVPKQRS